MISLFNFYRKYIDYFAEYVKSFNKLKTKGFKNAAKKKRERDKYIKKTYVRSLCESARKIQSYEKGFKVLKNKLCTAPVLKHLDFDKPFILYINESK